MKTLTCLVILMAGGIAYAGEALYTSSSDPVKIAWVNYNGDTLEVRLPGGAGGALPGEGGSTLTGITPGPFTFTLMLESPTTLSNAGGGQLQLNWTVAGTTEQHLKWETFPASGQQWTVVSSVTQDISAAPLVATLLAMRIVYDGTTVQYQHTQNGTDWTTLPDSIAAAEIPAGTWTFGFTWGGGPANVGWDIAYISLEGLTIPNVNTSGEEGEGEGEVIITGSSPLGSNVYAYEGDAVTFSVTAQGATSYAWLKDDEPISGENGDSFTIDPVLGPVIAGSAADIFAENSGTPPPPSWPGGGPPVLAYGGAMANLENASGAPDGSFATGVATFIYYQARNGYAFGFHELTGLSLAEVMSITQATFRVTYRTTQPGLFAQLEWNLTGGGIPAANGPGNDLFTSANIESFPLVTSDDSTATVDLVFPMSAIDPASGVGITDLFNVGEQGEMGEFRGLIGIVGDPDPDGPPGPLQPSVPANFDIKIDSVELIVEYGGSGNGGLYTVVASNGGKAEASRSWFLHVLEEGQSVPAAGALALCAAIAALAVGGARRLYRKK